MWEMAVSAGNRAAEVGVSLWASLTLFWHRVGPSLPLTRELCSCEGQLKPLVRRPPKGQLATGLRVLQLRGRDRMLPERLQDACPAQASFSGAHPWHQGC